VVLSDDVAAGHLLAAEMRPGSRYILSDRYCDLREIAATVARVLGKRRIPPTLPLPFAKMVAFLSEEYSNVSGRPPLITRGQLEFMQWGPLPNVERARRELGWTPTPLEEGVRRTLAFLEDQGTRR
jgi:nucleoside-diphosphate-sugar epimerase